jgi:hypothetical protein
MLITVATVQNRRLGVLPGLDSRDSRRDLVKRLLVDYSRCKVLKVCFLVMN